MPERTSISLRRDLLLRLWLPLLCLLLASAVAVYALARHYAERVYDRWLWDSAMSLATVAACARMWRSHALRMAGCVS